MYEHKIQPDNCDNGMAPRNDTVSTFIVDVQSKSALEKDLKATVPGYNLRINNVPQIYKALLMISSFLPLIYCALFVLFEIF